MEYCDILDLCLYAGLEFLKREPLALLMEAPIRLALQTACLTAQAAVELEVGYRKNYGSEFLRLCNGRLLSREGSPTNNIFALNTKETCDIRVALDGTQDGIAFELKCSGDFGTNRNLSYKTWKEKDLKRLFTQGLSKNGGDTESMIEGAILAASSQRYGAIQSKSNGLLVDFNQLPTENLSTFQVKYGDSDCWLRGGRCEAFGEKRAIICITRWSYLG